MSNYGGGPVGVEGTMGGYGRAYRGARPRSRKSRARSMIQCGYLQRTPRRRRLLDSAWAFRHSPGLAEPSLRSPRSSGCSGVAEEAVSGQRRRLQVVAGADRDWWSGTGLMVGRPQQEPRPPNPSAFTLQRAAKPRSGEETTSQRLFARDFAERWVLPRGS